jgi:uncharacterized membrane protein
MWLWVVILFFPVVILNWQSIPAIVWVIMIASAIFDSLYYGSIARAYKSGDLSIVYPLSRGTAPVFILLWSTLLLKERPSVGGIMGIALIVAGLYFLNLPRLGAWRDSLRAFDSSAPRWALAAGLCVSLYTTTDRVGVGYVSPLLYTYLTMTLMVACMTPGTLRVAGWSGLINEWRSSKFTSMIAGIISMTAYSIVLYAMKTGLPASYAGATREISVIFGTVVGIVLLKEQGTFMRVLGSILVAVGAGTIALLG